MPPPSWSSRCELVFILPFVLKDGEFSLSTAKIDAVSFLILLFEAKRRKVFLLI